jgi:hypothetical protein
MMESFRFSLRLIAGYSVSCDLDAYLGFYQAEAVAWGILGGSGQKQS